MVKGRTSRTSRSGQRGAPKGPQSVLAAPEAQTDAPIADAAPETGAPSLPIVPAHPQDSLHEQLLESVSPDALETHPQTPEPESEPEPESVPVPEAVSEAAAEPEPATLDAASEAPDSEPEAVIEPEPAAISAAEPAAEVPVAEIPAAEPVEAAGHEPESVPESAPEPAPEPALPALAEPALPALAEAPVSAPLATASETVRAATSGFQRLSVGLKAQPLDIGGINATLFAFLRNESAAALAHIQALSTAKSPADLIRLQVGEMQRAADASLTCWNDLARKASHVVEIRRH
jgi:hypothetical protein